MSKLGNGISSYALGRYRLIRQFKTIGSDLSSDLDMLQNVSNSLTSAPITKALDIFSSTLLSSVGLTGHMLVFVALYRQRSLRTIPNLIILNLSVADFLFSATVPPISILHSLLGQIPPAKETCLISGVAAVLFCFASINTLVFVSIERFMATNYPVRHRHLFDTKFVKVILILIWSWSLLLCIISLATIRYGYVEKPFHCTIDYENNLPVVVVFFAVGYALPFTVLVYCNISVLRAMRRRRGIGNTTSARLDNLAEKIRIQRERRISVVLITVIITFAVFFMPYCVVMFCQLSEDCTFSPEFMWTAMMLVALSSCCNPIINGVMNKNFRKAFRNILCCQ